VADEVHAARDVDPCASIAILDVHDRATVAGEVADGEGAGASIEIEGAGPATGAGVVMRAAAVAAAVAAAAAAAAVAALGARVAATAGACKQRKFGLLRLQLHLALNQARHEG